MTKNSFVAELTFKPRLHLFIIVSILLVKKVIHKWCYLYIKT